MCHQLSWVINGYSKNRRFLEPFSFSYRGSILCASAQFCFLLTLTTTPDHTRLCDWERTPRWLYFLEHHPWRRTGSWKLVGVMCMSHTIVIPTQGTSRKSNFIFLARASQAFASCSLSSVHSMWPKESFDLRMLQIAKKSRVCIFAVSRSSSLLRVLLQYRQLCRLEVLPNGISFCPKKSIVCLVIKIN